MSTNIDMLSREVLLIRSDMSDQEEMITAIKTGDLDTVKLMLIADPSLASAKDVDGTSAVLVATYWGRANVARELLAHNPDLSVFEASAAGQLDRVKTLVNADPSLIQAYSHDGFTPLHLAVFFGRRDVAEYLLTLNPDVNAVSRNPMKVQPLHSAAAGNDFDICKSLIEKGADVNARQEGGFTPLHSAAQNGNAALVKFLLTHGADRHAKTDDGRTARDFALEAKHEEVAEVLSGSER
jgi:ankyrin repeat protein